MATNIGWAAIQVIPSFANVQQNLTKGLAGPMAAAGNAAGKKFSEGLARNLKSTGGALQKAGTIATVGMTAPILAGFSKAANAAGDLNESVNAVNVVFGKASGKILDFSKIAAGEAGLSARAFNELVTPIGASLQNVGFSADQAAGSSINLAKRAADMASVFNVDVNEALAAIQAGLRGEADPLERFGVGLSDAAVTAHALELGLGNTRGELDANAKTQARLSLIMKQSNRVAGDFKRTIGEAANAERDAAAKAENLAAKFGQKLLPMKTKMIKLGSALLDRFNKLSPSMQNTALATAGVAAAAGPVAFALGTVFKGVGSIITTTPKVVGALKAIRLGWIMKGAAALKSGLLTARIWLMYRAEAAKSAGRFLAAQARIVAGWAAMGAKSLLAAAKVALAWVIAMGPIAIVGAAVVGLTVLVVKNWDKIRAATRKAWEWVVDKIRGAWEWVVGLFKRTTPVGVIISHWDTIRDKTEAVWDFLRAFLKAAWETIVATVREKVDKAKAYVLAAFEVLKDSIIGKVTTLASSLREAWATIASKVREAAGNAKDWAVAAFGLLKDRVVEKVTALKDSVIGRALKLVEWWKSLPGRLVNALGNLGRLLIQAGRDLISGFIQGAKDKIAEIPRQIGEATRGIGSWLVNSTGGPTVTPGGGISPGISSLVGIGKALQERGFRVAEHPAFGGVAPVHSRNSYHYQGRALDINWSGSYENTRLAQLAAELRARFGARIKELYHPGYDPYGGHSTHLHLAMAHGGIVKGGRGGVTALLGERNRSELVAPLPPGFDVRDLPSDKAARQITYNNTFNEKVDPKILAAELNWMARPR